MAAISAASMSRSAGFVSRCPTREMSRAATRRYACWDAGARAQSSSGGTCAWGGECTWERATTCVRSARARRDGATRGVYARGSDHRPDREAGTTSFPLEMDQPSKWAARGACVGAQGCVCGKSFYYSNQKGIPLRESCRRPPMGRRRYHRQTLESTQWRQDEPLNFVAPPASLFVPCAQDAATASSLSISMGAAPSQH